MGSTAAAIIGIQAGDNERAEIRELGATSTTHRQVNCASSMPITSVRG